MLHFNTLIETEEFAPECEDLEDHFAAEPVDEFYELAATFAKLSIADNVRAKRRRIYERLSDLCDRA
jgi:hypothetical protein